MFPTNLRPILHGKHSDRINFCRKWKHEKVNSSTQGFATVETVGIAIVTDEEQVRRNYWWLINNILVVTPKTTTE